MTTLKSLLLASATLAAGFVSLGAHAAVYTSTSTTTSETVTAPAPTVTYTRIVGGRPVAVNSTVAVGTRKVGMVGYHPYPIEAAQTEKTVIHDTPTGLVAHTRVSHTGGEIVPDHGGPYYTATDGSFYADPAWNVQVHSSGGYND
jgi:hypothetical protein